MFDKSDLFMQTNPISPIFRLKTMISTKNKANSNPIQTQTKPISAHYEGDQSQTNPIRLLFSFISLLFYLQSAKMAQKLKSLNHETTSEKNVTSYKQTC
jgi:hypothetical protein